MSDKLEVGSRQFSREFAGMKDLARSGTKIRVRDGAATFSFELISERSGFLGATQGALKSRVAPEGLFSTGEVWDSEGKA